MIFRSGASHRLICSNVFFIAFQPIARVMFRFLKRVPSRMTVNSSTAIALSHNLSVKAIITPWEAEEMWVPIL